VTRCPASKRPCCGAGQALLGFSGLLLLVCSPITNLATNSLDAKSGNSVVPNIMRPHISSPAAPHQGASRALKQQTPLEVQEERIMPIVFVHVFKCGGSSLRDVFRNFAKSTDRSLVTLVKCGVSPSRDHPCKLKDLQRRRKSVDKGEKVALSKKALKEIKDILPVIKESDVVQGHVWYGISGLPEPIKTKPAQLESPETTRYAQYITWVRNPLSLFFSGVLFTLNEKETKKDEVDRLSGKQLKRKAISSVRKRSFNRLQGPPPHSTFAGYYLPRDSLPGLEPQGVERGASEYAGWNEEKYISAMEDNLRNFDVIGVLEKHKLSMLMLQHLIDPKSLSSPSSRADSPVPRRSKQFDWLEEAKIRSNAAADFSTLTTERLMADVKENHSELWLDVLQVLKSDFAVYRFAVARHIEQCEAMVSSASQGSGLQAELRKLLGSSDSRVTGSVSELCKQGLDPVSGYADYDRLLADAKAAVEAKDKETEATDKKTEATDKEAEGEGKEQGEMKE